MIPCSIPSITEKERRFVDDAMKNSDIGVGPYIKKFESAWAFYNKYQYGVSCNSGTNALYLALAALGIGEGDEVIVPSYTMIATAWAVTYTGAKPVFVDCDDTLNMNPLLILRALTKNTKAIIPVHIYGRPCRMKEIMEIAQRRNLYVIEDMAEAHGIMPVGDVACYSFYGNKIITTGEGGMCLTKTQVLADEIRLIANMYFDKGRTMIHPQIGHNFRMTNLQAAVGYAQVGRIEEILNARDRVQFQYDTFLHKRFLRPIRKSVWMYDIDCGNDQEKIKQALAAQGVESRYGFKPMEMQPMYQDEYASLNSYKWSKRILYLPTYPDLSEKDIKFICDVVNKT